ncbi:MAG TPA: hypothetical protein VFJ30_08635 [Phycisphaerae bacterium]|nr:hypothetical protein [Phycisphaerae bacterium]
MDVERIESLVKRAADAALPDAERLAAFEQIVRRFQQMAYGCAYAILGDFHAAEEVRHCSVDVHRPVLVAARTVAECERLSELLGGHGIQNQLLNALPHRAGREAEVVAAAGRCRPGPEGKLVGAVTVATLMAGRGTDIQVDEEAIERAQGRTEARRTPRPVCILRWV